jgi:G3E family GTPase
MPDPSPQPIDLYLITGFLGSGKTTLLNRLIHAFAPPTKLMVLMNEFGEMGIDGQLIQGPEGLELLEISRGSVFCACVKRDFIQALATIAREIRPQVLIIEATGTANPTDIRKDLDLPLFKGRFHLREQICLLDAENFLAAYDAFSAVEKQIAAATRFLLNKTDLATAEDLAAIRAALGRHHPDPIIHETTYAQIPLGEWLNLPAEASSAPNLPQGPEPQSVEQALNALLNDPFGALAPPDLLASAVFEWSGRDRSSWEAVTRQFPAGIVRAKGFVAINGSPHLFSRVGTTHDLTPWPHPPVPSELMNRLVVIGPPSALNELGTRAATQPHLQRVSQRDPFSPSCD